MPLGFSDAEIESFDERLVDAIVAIGDVPAVAGRVREQREAGASHVLLQALGEGVGLEALRALAPAVL